MDLIWIALIAAAVVAVLAIIVIGRGPSSRRSRRPRSMPRPSDPPSPEKRQW